MKKREKRNLVAAAAVVRSGYEQLRANPRGSFLVLCKTSHRVVPQSNRDWRDESRSSHRPSQTPLFQNREYGNGVSLLE